MDGGIGGVLNITVSGGSVYMRKQMVIVNDMWTIR